jgi:predicted transcriptional regulator
MRSVVPSAEEQDGATDEDTALPDHYSLTRFDQVRALADEVRFHVLERLAEQPLTVTQLETALGISRGLILYHVRTLVQVGLVVRVASPTPSARGKLYRAVARTFDVAPDLFHFVSTDPESLPE